MDYTGERKKQQGMTAKHNIWAETSDSGRLVCVDVLQNNLQDIRGGGHFERSAAGGLKRAEEITLKTAPVQRE